MANNSALGRGLNALLPGDDDGERDGTVRQSQLYQFDSDEERMVYLAARSADELEELFRRDAEENVLENGADRKAG